MNNDAIRILFCRAVLVSLLGALLAGCAGSHRATNDGGDSIAEVKPHSEMTVYILATCPHCARALEHSILPLYHDMAGALSLSVEYIGTVDESGVPDLAHGNTEVESATLQICASNVADSPAWFEFMGCLYKNDRWRHINKHWEKCARRASIPVADIQHCVAEGGGKTSLIRSIATSAADGIQAAPTLIIDGKEFVGPIDKQSLLTYVCYFAGKKSTRPDLCHKVKKPKTLHAIALNDVRCGDKCDVERELAFIQALFPAMEISELDYSEPDGKALYNEIKNEVGDGTVPVLYIQETMDDLGNAAIPLAQYMIDFGDGFILPMGEGVDPTQEICDNEKDDDANNLSDCEDPGCINTLYCRPEIQHRMDVFIMSQCPYGAMIIPTVDHVINHLRENGSDAKVRFQFIGNITDGTLYSMHGESEVNEDLRMACIQELYSENHDFMSYMLCRAGNYRSDDWQKCLSENMVEADVTNCATGTQGYQLISESFKMANDVGRHASPSWLLNNRIDMDARTSKEILAAYCDANDDPACEKEIKSLLIESNASDEQQCGE